MFVVEKLVARLAEAPKYGNIPIYGNVSTCGIPKKLIAGKKSPLWDNLFFFCL